MDSPSVIRLGKIGDRSIGFISVAQHPEIPFDIKRIYWVFGTPPQVERGNHAGKTSSQVMIAIHGTVKVSLENTKNEKMEFLLNNPEEGLFVPPMHWRKVLFSDDSVLLVISSSQFNESDYIRDYEEFIQMKN